MTVFNEAESMEAWLDSLSRQSRQPDEIVICDGGSTDGTVEILRSRTEKDQRLRVLIVPGANVPEGRNLAISECNGEVVAVTDAGTILEPDWFERILEPLEKDPTIAVSSGFYRPDGRNAFEKVLATAITPGIEEFAEDGFPPSSRSIAFRKCWWKKVGGYPEWLRAGEDLVFDYRLKQAGAQFRFAPDAVVSWYPRPNIKAFFNQYRHYARGDGHGKLRTWKHLVRIGSWMAGVVLLPAAKRSRLLRLALTLGFAVHMRPQLKRVAKNRPRGVMGTVRALVLVPVIVVVGDLARMVGYPQGVWERWRAGGPDGLKEARIKSHRSESAIRGLREQIPVRDDNPKA